MMNLTVYGQTDVGLVRKVNEDAFVVADLTTNATVEGPLSRFVVGPRGVLVAVSDGMGGHRAGEVASALTLQSLLASMASSSQRPPEEALEAAVNVANRDVWQAAHEAGQKGMGATLTAMFVEGTSIHIAEVGDSRAYLLRGGNLVQLTHDQSYVQVLIDAGAMTPEEAEEAPMKNIILQAMGQKAAVTVALATLSLRQRDCFLLCSDGLSNKVSSEEIRQIILAAPRMDAACDALVQLAKKNGGEDNITVIIGGVSGDLPPLVVGEDVSTTLAILNEFSAPARV